MYDQKSLIIQPEFQREIVWKGPAQTRFIDSLMKQLPIPSMCFSLDYKVQKWQVIDGLQRIWTIIRFLSDKNWILSDLDDIDPKISGKPVSLFHDQTSPLHEFYRRVQNVTLPVTVLRCDYAKKEHANYLFTIFHRLNTGGMKLNNQEIRNCIYAGRFNDLLKQLNKNLSWMRLNKMKADISYRFTKEELILRFFAFHDRLSTYTGYLAKFLNDYMLDHRDASPAFLDEKTRLFERTVDLIFKRIYSAQGPRKLSLTLFEALLVGVGSNIDRLEKVALPSVKVLARRLSEHEELSEERLSEGLSKRERVISRLSAAKKVFGSS
jgi:hypothetical protein